MTQTFVRTCKLLVLTQWYFSCCCLLACDSYVVMSNALTFRNRAERTTHALFSIRTLFTAHKWSLGQGNIFTCVCLSTGLGVSVQGGLCPGRVSVQGGSLSRTVSVQGGSVQLDLCQGNPRKVKSRPYASFWNAFLSSCCCIFLFSLSLESRVL